MNEPQKLLTYQPKVEYLLTTRYYALHLTDEPPICWDYHVSVPVKPEPLLTRHQFRP